MPCFVAALLCLDVNPKPQEMEQNVGQGEARHEPPAEPSLQGRHGSLGRVDLGVCLDYPLDYQQVHNNVDRRRKKGQIQERLSGGRHW